MSGPRSVGRSGRGRRPLSVVAAAGLLLTAIGCSASEQPVNADAARPAAEAPAVNPEGERQAVPPGRAATKNPTSRERADHSLPRFSATVQTIGPALRARMSSSHHPGCPVGLADLRYLRMSFVGFDGNARSGEMVVHADQARAVVGVFRRLYAARWPIRRMRLVDDYGGDDARSMSANNTSGYNCRRTSSGERWSEHAYGRAIDINPVQNPYVVGSRVAPRAGRPFARVDRSGGGKPLPGVISSTGPVVAAFDRIGWEWGGKWVNSSDYQHFSATGL